jgi:hypothetical protein
LTDKPGLVIVTDLQIGPFVERSLSYLTSTAEPIPQGKLVWLPLSVTALVWP